MSRYWQFTLALLVGLPITSNSHASAECDGAYVIYQDKFTEASPDWYRDSGVSIGRGKMIIQVTPAKPTEFVEYQKHLLWNTDPRPTEICADFRFPAQAQGAVEEGIFFWSIVSRRNVFDGYLWVVSNTGSASLKRINGDQWDVIFSDPITSIKTGANALNSLRVTVDSAHVSFFVNGSIVRSVSNIFQPTGSTRYGVGGFLLEPLRAAALIEVTNFKVTTPYAPIGTTQ